MASLRKHFIKAIRDKCNICGYGLANLDRYSLAKILTIAITKRLFKVAGYSFTYFSRLRV